MGTITTEDGFAIDIVLRHATRRPESFTIALSLQPEFAWASGAFRGGQTMQSTRWQARLADGAGDVEFGHALQTAASFLESHAEFFRGFAADEGEADLVMNHAAISDVGKVFEVSYSPSFLCSIAALGVGLKVQAWSGEAG